MLGDIYCQSIDFFLYKKKNSVNLKCLMSAITIYEKSRRPGKFRWVTIELTIENLNKWFSPMVKQAYKLVSGKGRTILDCEFAAIVHLRNGKFKTNWIQGKRNRVMNVKESCMSSTELSDIHTHPLWSRFLVVPPSGSDVELCDDSMTWSFVIDVTGQLLWMYRSMQYLTDDDCNRYEAWVRKCKSGTCTISELKDHAWAEFGIELKCFAFIMSDRYHSCEFTGLEL